MTSYSNRTNVAVDPNFALIQASAGDQAFQGDYDGGTNLIYKGYARPGTSTSAAAWQIAMITYDGNNNVTSITWPQNSQGVATNQYIFIWDDRADYTYS
jgi:hypothetical protein